MVGEVILLKSRLFGADDEAPSSDELKDTSVEL